MKPVYDIIEMIRAHYQNDDDAFNTRARAVIDYCKKDGDIQGAEEIFAIMSGKRETPREDTPKYLSGTEAGYTENESCVTYETDEFHKEDKDNNPEESIDVLIERATNSKKAENNSDTSDDTSVTKITVIKPKRHRRTKEEMETYRNSEEYKQVEQEKENNHGKRHRRTKEELIAAGYYNK